MSGCYWRLLSVALVAIPSPSGLPAAEKNESLFIYLPLGKGAFWSYASPEAIDAGWVSLRVLDQQKTGKFDCYTLEISNNSVAGPMRGTTSVCLSGAGHSLAIAKDRLMEYDPPLPILKQPLLPGQKWKWEGKEIWNVAEGRKEKRAAEYEFQIESEEDLRVTAGSFKALRLIIRKGGLPADAAVRYWLAKGAGIVKATGFGLLFGIHGELKEYSRPVSETK